MYNAYDDSLSDAWNPDYESYKMNAEVFGEASLAVLHMILSQAIFGRAAVICVC